MNNRIPPYVPFKTLRAHLEGLISAGLTALPKQLTKETVKDFVPFTVSQLLGAYRFMALIDAEGTPLSALVRIVEVGEPKALKDQLKPVLKDAYGNLFDQLSADATQKELDAILGTYGINGNTLEKARTFFLHSAEFTGIPLSSRLRGRKGRKVNDQPVQEAQNTQSEETVIEKQPAASQKRTRKRDADMHIGKGESKMVRLKTGGTLTLSVSANVKLFDLEGDDRDFVYRLIDEMKAYEKGGGTAMNIAKIAS